MTKQKEVTVVEIIIAIPGKLSELKKALADLVPLCEKEEGCIKYTLLECASKKEELLILMCWKDMKYLLQHEASDPIQEFSKKYDSVLYSEVIQTEWFSSKW